MLLLPVLLLGLLAASTGTAAARGLVESDPTRASRQPGPPPVRPIGYDISYPQCGHAFPTNVAFGIVGVNGGRVYSENPCLGAGDLPSQLEWAGMDAQLYANTGNPGPELSRYWPVGQTEPRPCSVEDPDTADCAYDYGWNAAADSYETAVAAYISLGWAEPDATRTPVANAWWLDVETANSWRTDDSLNVAALQGALDYLESVGADSVGFYSAPFMWDDITGGTDAFADHPTWVAGASTLKQARRLCGEGFTGADVELSQYFAHGFDANHRC